MLNLHVQDLYSMGQVLPDKIEINKNGKDQYDDELFENQIYENLKNKEEMIQKMQTYLCNSDEQPDGQKEMVAYIEQVMG